MALQIRLRRSGPIQGVTSTLRQIRTAVAEEAGRATVRRVSRRIDDHPAGRLAGNAMTVSARNGRATIISPMGNPGRIPATRNADGYSRWGKRALWWPGAPRPVRWVNNYKGLRPLMEAEMSRVGQSDFRPINMTTTFQG